jgi:plastocyanin
MKHANSPEDFMSTQQIQIQTNQPYTLQPGKFNPQAATANAGDNITWFNADTTSHWPTPNASDKSAWFKTEIKPGDPSGGQVALGPNPINVTAASNTNPVVLTVEGTAPASGAPVTLSYDTDVDDDPWQTAINNLQQPVTATNVAANQCSVLLDATGLGAMQGTLTVNVPYTINYVCALHPQETGSITVNPQQ